MQSDGRVLPDLAETTVLHHLGLVRSDELPDIAARWLAADLVDTESARMLAGHDTHDPWALEQLLADSLAEAVVIVPSTPDEKQRIAVEWVTMLARKRRHSLGHRHPGSLGETDAGFDLGLFVGLDDEWSGRWG